MAWPPPTHVVGIGLDRVVTPSRAARLLALLLLTTGTLHLAAPSGFESIVPGFLGSPAFWVYASGVAELVCAAGLVLPRTQPLVGWACVVLFVVVFPANITMAVQSLHGQGSVLLAWLRLPLQVPLVLCALYVARRTPRPDRSQESVRGYSPL